MPYANDDVRILPPDSTLMEKLGNVNLDEVFSSKTVETAQMVIANSSDILFEETIAGITQLESLQQTIASSTSKSRDVLPKIVDLSFSIKGSASLAGYDLVATIAKSLQAICEQLDPRSLTPTQLQITAWHIDSLKKVVSLKVKGTGGDAGVALQKELDTIEKMFFKDKPTPANN